MADALIKHAFVSAVAEGTDPAKIRTSNWNASLLFSAGTDGQVLTRSAASATGAAWSAAPDPAAAIAAALAAYTGSAALVTLGAATAASLNVTGALTSPIGATGSKTFLSAPLSGHGAVGDYNFTVGYNANPGDGARGDHVMSVGYNTLNGGGRAILAEPCLLAHLHEHRGDDDMAIDEALWQALDRLIALNRDPVLA